MAKSKITAVQTAFSYGGTINQPTNQPNLVPTKEYAIGTAVI